MRRADGGSPRTLPWDGEAATRLRPVLSLARRCGYAARHTHQVTRLALALFDQLRPVHGLGAPARWLLLCAGLLHDIGWLEGQPRHHKTALRLILEADGLPFTRRERHVVALVARYHRKALPSTSHPVYADLPKPDRRLVRLLAGILRVADGLDRTHRSVVRRLRCCVSSGQIEVQCETVGSAEVDRQTALAKGDLLERAFRRRLRVTATPAAQAAPARAPEALG